MKYKTCLILFAIAAALIWFQITGHTFINQLKPKLIDFTKFPLKISTKFIAGIYSLATPQNRYEEKILLLEKKIALLTKLSTGIQEVLGENQRLRSLLAFKAKPSQRSIAAEVIAKGPLNLVGFIIIDKGSSDGIAPNMSVAKDEGLVGRVFETGENTSKVMLIDNPNSRIGVVIQRTREQGVLIGLGGGFCKIVYLARDTETKPGDIVVSSELNNVSGRGILVGEVAKVLKSSHSLYASAVVRPCSNLFKIEEVLCIE